MQTPPFARTQGAQVIADLQFVREHLPRISARDIAIAHHITLRELDTAPTLQTIDDLIEGYETFHTIAELLGLYVIEMHTLRHIARKLRRDYLTYPTATLTANDYARIQAGAELIDELTAIGTDTLMMFAAVKSCRKVVQ